MSSQEKYITIKRIPQDRMPREIYEGSTYSIGGSISSETSDVLKGLSFAEEQIILPNIINTPSTSVHFLQKCREFWQDIDIKIPVEGLTLNISTHRVILETPIQRGSFGLSSKQLSKSDSFDLELGGEEVSILEKEVGEDIDDGRNFDMPINPLDYVHYKYAMMHGSVAKNLNDAIAFDLPCYIEDKQIEDNKEMLRLSSINKARKSIDKFLTYMDDLTDAKKNDYASLYAIAQLTKEYHNQPVVKDSKVMLKTIWSLCELIPEKVTALANDKDLKNRLLVDSLVNYQIIESIDNKFYDKKIGNDPVATSIDEYIKFINLPANKDVLARLKATLSQKNK